MVRVLITLLLSLTIPASALCNNEHQVIRKRVYLKMYNLIAVPFLVLFFATASAAQTGNQNDDLELNVADTLKNTTGYTQILMIGPDKDDGKPNRYNGWLFSDTSRKSDNISRAVVMVGDFVCFNMKVGKSNDVNLDCLNGDVYAGKQIKVEAGHYRINGNFMKAGPARIIMKGFKSGNLKTAKKELNSSDSEKLERLLSQQVGSEVALPTDAAKNAPLTSSISQLDKAKSTCTELGFTLGTEKHGDCVLKMMDN